MSTRKNNEVCSSISILAFCFIAVFSNSNTILKFEPKNYKKDKNIYIHIVPAGYFSYTYKIIIRLQIYFLDILVREPFHCTCVDASKEFNRPNPADIIF